MSSNYWDTIAQLGSDDDVKEAILAGYLQGKPFDPDHLRLHWPVAQEKCRTCDFGCGIGRNWPMLLARSSAVYAYDRPEMLKRVPFRPHRLFIISTCEQLDVDVVYCSLVLQHIEVAQAIRMMPTHRYLHVLNRARHDFNTLGTFAHIPASDYRLMGAVNTRTGSFFTWPEIMEDTSEEHYEAMFERKHR